MLELYRQETHHNYQEPIISTKMPVAKKAEKRDRLSERNTKIRDYYKTRWQAGYRTDKIIEELGAKYFLDAITLEAIVFKRNCYKEF